MSTQPIPSDAPSRHAAPQPADRGMQIVAAAYDLLDEDGLEGLTIRAVLSRTGLARRAFYERFSGKDDLLLAVFDQAIRRAAEGFRDQVAALPDPLDRLKLIVTCIVLGKREPADLRSGQGTRRGAAMSREHLRLAEARPDDLQLALRPLLDLIAEQLAAGIAAGAVRAYEPQRLAVLVYNLVSTTALTEFMAHETAGPDPARHARLAEDIWDFCRRAITA